MTRKEAIYELEHMKTWSKDLSDDEIEAIVIALKALEQEPRIGHWIYRMGDVPFKWKCSRCFAASKTDFNYCPSCGTRMEDE